MTLPLLRTVGHSTHDFNSFIAMLDSAGIELLVDVRSHPGSRKFPHFNRAYMASTMGNRYFFMGDTLGGPTEGVYSDPLNFPKHHIGKRRPGMKKSDEASLFPTWTNQGLYDYGVWMASGTFRRGLDHLEYLTKAHPGRVAICCAECLWWKCHRSMIADAWEALGGTVEHIWPTRAPTRHVLGNRLSRYEPETQKIWGG